MVVDTIFWHCICWFFDFFSYEKHVISRRRILMPILPSLLQVLVPDNFPLRDVQKCVKWVFQLRTYYFLGFFLRVGWVGVDVALLGCSDAVVWEVHSSNVKDIKAILSFPSWPPHKIIFRLSTPKLELLSRMHLFFPQFPLKIDKHIFLTMQVLMDILVRIPGFLENI